MKMFKSWPKHSILVKEKGPWSKNGQSGRSTGEGVSSAPDDRSRHERPRNFAVDGKVCSPGQWHVSDPIAALHAACSTSRSPPLASLRERWFVARSADECQPEMNKFRCSHGGRRVLAVSECTYTATVDLRACAGHKTTQSLRTRVWIHRPASNIKVKLLIVQACSATLFCVLLHLSQLFHQEVDSQSTFTNFVLGGLDLPNRSVSTRRRIQIWSLAAYQIKI